MLTCADGHVCLLGGSGAFVLSIAKGQFTVRESQSESEDDNRTGKTISENKCQTSKMFARCEGA